jgi:DNA-binding transcriptional regulator YiaG
MQPTEIKETREALGYTQQKLADLTGVQLRSYQRYEAGQRTPGKTWLMLFEIIIKKSKESA